MTQDTRPVYEELYKLNTTSDTFVLTTYKGLIERLLDERELVLKWYSKSQKITSTIGQQTRKELHDALDAFLNELVKT